MEIKDEFVADVTRYSGPLREAAKDADRFGDKNEKAALAARKMGLAASTAADKAAKAQRQAADAAERLAKGELSAEEAASAAAKAERELERASIKAAEAQRATAKAADTAADNFRQLARDAELAAAAEQLGALKAAGATTRYNTELKRLQDRHGSLAKTALSGFKMMESGGNSAYRTLTAAGEKAAASGPLLEIAIGNALAALPSIAAAAAGGITLALGGAVAGLGIMFAAKNKQIRSEFGSLGKDIFSKLSADAAPFVDVLHHVAKEGSDAFARWEPEIKATWAEMAPAVDTFIGQAINSLDKLGPAFHSITKGFDAELAALGPRMGAIMNNIGTGIKAIADAAAANPQAFASLVSGLSQIVRFSGDAIGVLVRFKSAFDGLKMLALGPGPMDFLKVEGALAHAGGSLTDWLGITHKASGAATQWHSSLDGASSAAMETGMSTQQLVSAQRAAAMTSGQLKTALIRLTDANQTAFDATTSYRQALKDADQQAKKNNAGIKGSSDAALANRQALSALAENIKKVIEGGDQSAQSIKKMRDNFIDAAHGMGMSKEAAKKLADQLIGVSGSMKKVPSKVHTDITATDKSKAATAAAKKNAESFSHQVYRASLTAANKAGSAIRSATQMADRYAGKAFRAALTAAVKSGGAIQSATNAARRYAGAAYRASLTAVNNAWSALNSALAAGARWAGRVFTATFNVVKKLFSADGGYVEHFANGGSVQGYPGGGSVSGPGTSTSDSIPAMLSDGEYVIRASQVKKHKALLDAINYGLDGYAAGGGVASELGGNAKAKTKPVAGVLAGTPLSKAERAAAKVSLARARPEYLAALAAQQALASMRKSALGGITGSGLGSGYGSSYGTTVQHITNVQVTVHGSIRSDRDVVDMVQQSLLKGRKAVVLPAGR